MALEEHARYVPSSKRGYESKRRHKLNSIKSRDYSVLMFVGRVNSFLGWLMVIGCVIAAIAAFWLGWGGIGEIAGYISLALIPYALLIVASGQVTSCFVSTERNGAETTILLQEQTILLQRILYKMATTEKG